MREYKRLLSTIVFGLSTILLIAICFYGIHRNNEVLKFRSQLVVQSLFLDSEVHEEYTPTIYDRYSYDEMFFSLKPLRSHYWFTDEEIEKFKLYLVDEACEYSH